MVCIFMILFHLKINQGRWNILVKKKQGKNKEKEKVSDVNQEEKILSLPHYVMLLVNLWSVKTVKTPLEAHLPVKTQFEKLSKACCNSVKMLLFLNDVLAGAVISTILSHLQPLRNLQLDTTFRRRIQLQVSEWLEMRENCGNAIIFVWITRMNLLWFAVRAPAKLSERIK